MDSGLSSESGHEAGVAHRRVAERILPTTLAAFTALYLVLASAHLVLLDEPLRSWLSVAAALTALSGIVLLALHFRKQLQARASAVMVFVSVALCCNGLLHLVLSGDPRQVTNVVLALTAVGIMLTRTATFLAVAVPVVVVTQGLVASVSGHPDFLHYQSVLLLGCVLAAIAHRVRRQGALDFADLDWQREESRHQHEYLSLLLDHVGAGVVVHDITGAVVRANPRALEIMRMDEAEAMRRSASPQDWQFVSADGERLAEVFIPVNRVLSTRRPLETQLIGLKRETGSVTWVLVNGYPVFDDSQLIEVVITFQEVTGQVTARRLLAEREAHLRGVLTSIADGIVSVDANDCILSLNPAAERMLGISTQRAIGRHREEVFHFQPEECGGLGAEGSEADPAPEPRGRLTAAFAEDCLVEMRCSEVGSRRPGEPHRVYTLRNIARDLENERAQQAHARDETIALLASGIAHDFNNLLMGVYGNISVARSALEHGGDARTPLEDAGRSMEQATRLTRQLLTFSGAQRPMLEKTNLLETLEDVLRLVLAGSPQRLETDYEDDLPLVMADSGQLHQALSNIVLNARQATPDGGLLSIQVRTRDAAEGEGRLDISVRDSGPGIDPSDLDRIFDPYFTTKTEGSGLGLTTARSIIVNHGGDISINTEPGKGTEFLIELPIPDESALADVADVEESGDENELNRRLRILAMDDEDLVRDVIVELLRHLGHEVVAVSDGGAAVEAYREAREAGRPFDVALMDLTVPGGMGGAEASRRVLAIHPRARIIVASGYSADTQLADWREQGYRAVLQKPFVLEQLKEAISQATGTRSGPRAASRR